MLVPFSHLRFESTERNLPRRFHHLDEQLIGLLGCRRARQGHLRVTPTVEGDETVGCEARQQGTKTTKPEIGF